MTDGQATVVANPDDSGERVGALVADAHGKVFVGDWAADSLVFIEDGKATVVEVGAEEIASADVEGNPGSVAVTNAKP